MPPLRPPEPQVATRKVFLRIEEPLATTMERYADFLGTDDLKPRRQPNFALHLQTRYPVQIMAGAEPKVEGSEGGAIKGQIENRRSRSGGPVMQGALASKGLVAYVLACTTKIPASALAIGSWLALVPACAFIAVIYERGKLGEQFPKANLPGYAHYAKTVPVRNVSF